ncbi:hypothetical protein [Mycolicibacterium xanthum]|uniref:hypothetical protein n=1 Tax=Mycolicibacterium xanthum TaxID=2796469 RepID=UPI002103D3D3|nr:hypothetical protein [Mycolicibacterium xanthum]
MKVLLTGVIGALVAVALAGPARAIPDTGCRLSTPVQEVSRVTQLPDALQKMLPPLADVGVPFNSTDAVRDPSLPFRRLIRAGHRDDTWFVWYEHGGVGYFWQAVVARVDDDAVVTVANAGTISDVLCEVTDGALAGTVPPYPPGAWAAGSF